MYSLSTCWNSRRHTDGRAMLEEIRELGFEYAELSHGIRLSLVPGILDAVDAGVIRISTLHNFCPLPIGITHAAPNIFKFTSRDRRERERAVRQTFQTLDLAQRVGAKLVVLHMGSLDMRDYTHKLLELVGAGQANTPRYERLCWEVEERRQERRDAHEQHAYEILALLEREALRRGLMLGIENREALEEIPFETDFGFLFMQFNSGAVRYWHDTGHGQIKENLGFINHAEHVAGLAEHLAGFHIHDVGFPGRDHLPPGQGMIDFKALAPVVRPEHIKVLELHPSVTADEIRESLAFMKSVWGEE
ncbi:MAG: sugar phosphate isomerase/epimerase [Verrucomicrobia bacterium]|nr:MAG: sugar phosphate isomerase/epimerase [Verrucomicrobiota bacterium]